MPRINSTAYAATTSHPQNWPTPKSSNPKGLCGAGKPHALGPRPMSKKPRSVQVSVRVGRASKEAVRVYASAHGLSEYEVWRRAIERGLSELVSGQSDLNGASDPPVLDAIAEVLIAVERLEALADRNLHVAAAAYAYARHGALRPDPNPTKANVEITDQADATYRRQKELAK